MNERYSGYEYLSFDWPEARVLRITIDHQETLNSLDAQGHTEMTYVWREVDADPDVGAVILTGAGKAFSAGGDFSLVEGLIEDHKLRLRLWKETRDLVYNVINCGKPIVSAMNGVAVGAGLAAALLADISIAGENIKIVDGHTRLGVAAGDHSAIVWPLLCGLAKARYHLLLCEPMTGREAERMGLVALAVPDEEVGDKALETAQRLTEAAPSAVRMTKYALNNWLRQFGPAYDTSTALEFLGFSGDEVREGVASHREKRKPNFDPECNL